jgi:hypothetical protein
MSDSPRYLYRHFAADGSLLHVGIANSALRRLAEHHHNSRWYPFIKHVVIEAHPNMDAARIAESRAIAEENPRFNEAGRRWGSAEEAQREMMKRDIIPPSSRSGCANLLGFDQSPLLGLRHRTSVLGLRPRQHARHPRREISPPGPLVLHGSQVTRPADFNRNGWPTSGRNQRPTSSECARW